MIELLNEIVIFFIEIAPFMMLGLFFVGTLHVFVSKAFVAKHIGSDNIISSVKASILGVPLPLCSCGVVPTAVYFSKNGASKGSIISFLISTPQTGIDSIIATYGMLGPVFAIFRPLAAFVSGISGGIIANFFAKDVSFDNADDHSDCSDGHCSIPKKEGKLHKFYHYAFIEFLDDIAIQFIAGIIIAGLISFFIPADFFIKYNIGSGFLGMLLMIIVGIPMYICATASIPIALALMAKGVSPGAAFVFLAVGPMTNAASLTILYKVLKKKMLAIYIFTGSIFAVIFGFLLDILFSTFKWELPIMSMAHNHSSQTKMYLYNALAILFAFFLLMSIFRRIKSKFKREDKASNNTTTFNVDGMSCNHCVANVKNAVESVDGVQSVSVNLSKGLVSISGKNLDNKKIIKKINDAGYKASKP